MTYRSPAVLLAALWTLFILAACSIPGDSLPSVSLFEFDKLAHFTLFAVFGWLWMRTGRSRLRAATRWVLAAGVAYAVLTELYQGLLPWERQPDPLDALANTLGLTLAVLAYRARYAAREA